MKKPKPIGWKRPLADQIKLRDGHTIDTLGQAAGLMTKRLPKKRQQLPVWQRAAELLMQAHERGKPADRTLTIAKARCRRRNKIGNACHAYRAR